MRWVASIGVTAFWLVLAGAASASGWSSDKVPSPTEPQGALNGVSCLSASSCIAVGASTAPSGGSVPLAEYWNGSQWTVQQLPAAPGTGNSAFNGVSCMPGLCVAVGDASGMPLIETSAGNGWAVASTPAVSAQLGQLNSVSCSSPTACVAVGFIESSGSGVQILIERWDGGSWSLQSAPLPSGATAAQLSGVACTSAGCEAVGNTGPAGALLVEVATGSSWTLGSAQAPPGGNGGNLASVECLMGTLDCTAVGSSNVGNPAAPLAEHGTAGNLSIQSTRDVAGANDNELASVSCSAADACTAVGVANTRSQPLIEHWDGSTWAIQNSPNPPVADYHNMSGVSCPTAMSCIAVGGGPAVTGSSVPTGETFSETWDGTNWAVQPMPDTEPSSTSLTAISCPSSTVCLAVGSYDDLHGFSRPLAEWWNGTDWTLAPPLPAPSGDDFYLYGVSCSSATSCVAVGSKGYGSQQPFAEVWNGLTWTVESPAPVPVGAAALDGVSCTASTDCTAVGGFDAQTTTPLVEHWDGMAWTAEPDPLPAAVSQGALAAVACVGAADCFAVGNQETRGGLEGGLGQHWNGSAWTSSPLLGPDGSALASISCTSANACVAVGVTTSSTVAQSTFAVQWNGAVWSPAPPQNPATANNAMTAVSCQTATLCQAVGEDQASGSPTFDTLGEQWNGLSWSTLPTPNASDHLNLLQAIACPGVHTCLSVGYSSLRLAYFTQNTPIALHYSIPPSPPLNTAAPTVTGVTTVGQRLSASQGEWSGAQPMSFYYQWQRCAPQCQSIAGATRATYTAAERDAGSRLRVIVAAVNADGWALAVSAETAQTLPPGPTSAQIRTSLRRQLLRLPQSLTISRLIARGFTVHFTPPTAGKLQITWKRGGKVIATARRIFTTTRAVRLALRLNRAGRRQLRLARTVRILEIVSFRQASGRVVTVSATATLRRR